MISSSQASAMSEFQLSDRQLKILAVVSESGGKWDARWIDITVNARYGAGEITMLRELEQLARLGLSGETTVAQVSGRRTIFNLGTQRTWRTGAELWAIEAAVREMIGWAEQHDLKLIGMSKIGAGLGGLDWSDVAAAIEAIVGPSAVSVGI